MSFRGTLGDFGVADILQLIGSQTKTGVLTLNNGASEVRTSFVNGNVVKVEQAADGRLDPIGHRMVRAGVLTRVELSRAQQTQQRTQRRLADVLVDSGFIDLSTWKAFARLQTTEAIDQVFQWRAGSYEFVPQAVHVDDSHHEPLRTEGLLMEGFRRVDEWPAVRRLIPSADATLNVVGTVPLATGEDDVELDLEPDSDAGAPPRRIGAVERRVFALVTPGSTVADVVDHSLLGEFETSKALAALVANGIVAVGAPVRSDERRLVALRALVATEAVPFLVRCIVFVMLAALLGGLVRLGSLVPGGMGSPQPLVVGRDALREELAEVAARRIHASLAILRVENGRYPTTLDELVGSGLLLPGDLSFPYDTPWGYRAVIAEDRYDLAPPLR